MSLKDIVPPHVLIVDDDPQVCKIIKTFLDRSALFASVVSAENASIAIMKAKNQEFDLMIIDYQMPNKTGAELIDLFKHTKMKKRPKFMIISGYLNADALKQSLKVGVKHILVKPFNRVCLFEKIEAALLD